MTYELKKNANTGETGVKSGLTCLLFPNKTSRPSHRRGKGTHYRSKQREGMASFIMECLGL